jgi:hypothetical protein
MCDALSRNTPNYQRVTILLANCIAHGRRQFVDVAANSTGCGRAESLWVVTATMPWREQSLDATAVSFISKAVRDG